MAARQHQCAICLGSLKNPKLISCHHSFCYTCLEDYVRINLRNHRFDCPICKTNVVLPTGGVRGFLTNVYIDTNSGENFACDLCGPKSVACSRCLDCEENLCQSCCYVHEKLKVSKHHKISDLGILDSVMKGKIRQRIFCDQHQEEEIKLFCRDCNVLICVLCKAVNHQNHGTKTVADAAAEVKQVLQTKMSFCSDKMRRILTSKEKGEELDKCIDHAEREDLKSVEDQRSHLNQVLDQEVAKVKVKTRNVYYKRRLQNAAFRRDIENEIKICSNACENAKVLTGQGTDIEIIIKGPDLLQLISEAMSATERSPDTNLKNKLFLPAIIKKSNIISLIGIINDSTDTPLVTEASSPVVEKENKDPNEGTKDQDKVITTETTPSSPIVNEEVVDTVDINIENVDSSDLSVPVENEKNEKLKLKYKYKEDQWSPINHEGKKQYDRDFLLQLQNAPESALKPLDLPDIPDIIIEKSGGVPRWSSGQQGRGGPGGSAMQAKHTNLSIHKNIELHHATEAWKLGHRAERIDQGDVDLRSKPPETVASLPVVEKEIKDPNKGIKDQDKVIATETTPSSPIVNEELVDTVDINIENVDISDLSVPVKNEKNEKLKLKYKYKEVGTQEADPLGAQFIGISFQAPYQFSNIQSQFVPPYSYANAHDLNKQAYAAPRMPVGGTPSQAAMYQNSTGVRQQPYFNQTNMRPSGYQISQPQPSQGLYTQQQVMFMPPPQYSSAAQQVLMPMTASNYPQRMSSPAYQNSMPTTQQGLFQLPAKKRERTVFPIIDPNSGKDIMQEVQQARGTPPSLGTFGSRGTVNGQEISHIPQNEPAAQFAAQVAQVALSTCPGGNQQRTLSDAEDVKKDSRGRKKAKDINRKGEMRQGSEMDAFMDLPLETEASSPLIQKENKESTEGTKDQDKAIASKIYKINK